ncbi:MAG: hypothetical protein NUV80_01200 [Candidatus Berkelbacteria bacterium]|nr:hypothetical protein [Candidatus Berkelbacteria bacterium]
MKTRTSQQNKALWKYFELLAEALNDAGFDIRKTLKQDIDIPWTKNSVHDYLWIPVLKAMTDKESTTDMNTVEPSEVYEVLTRHLGEKTGVFVEWPSVKP